MTDRKGGARVVKFRGEVWLWVPMADVRSRLLNVTKLPSRAGSHFPELGEERTATHFAISVRIACHSRLSERRKRPALSMHVLTAPRGRSQRSVGGGRCYALADQLGWREFHVVGRSMGGKAAQKIAMDAGARVQSVAWCNCPHTVCERSFCP